MSRTIRLHVFMHVPFEGPGAIALWAERKGHSMRYSRFYLNDPLPLQEGVDLLVIMGGPMSVYDLHSHPRMKEEIEWVRDFIRTGRPVLGICLGA